MYTLLQYLHTLSDPEGLTRTLRGIDIMRSADGRPVLSSGNSAATFRLRIDGHEKALKCYFTPHPHLKEIYGDRLLEKELYLFTSPHSGEWVDVVLNDWVEGISLDRAVREAAARRDITTLEHLSRSFDTLALDLLGKEWAHGDLKPENILLTPNGRLQLIDFDACFLPRFSGERSAEIGTAAYQHPTRDNTVFDVHIDDYPIALISTALHALCCDPSLPERYPSDGLIFTPGHIARSAALDQTLSLFERRGMAAAYHIALLLLSPTHRLPRLEGYLHALTQRPRVVDPLPELFVEEGLWGFRTPHEVVIPPLYHSGFDFTEGLAAVELGHTWHFIALDGTVRLTFEGCQAVKPFRNGRTRVLRNGELFEYDTEGRLFEN